MPRKFPVEAYRPAELPDTLPHLITHLYDEFLRISAALVEFPVAMNVNEDQAGVPVETVPQEFRLFEGVSPTLDLPGGDWDSVLGEWSCLIQAFIRSTCQPQALAQDLAIKTGP